jgi:glycosyl transferase family 2
VRNRDLGDAQSRERPHGQAVTLPDLIAFGCPITNGGLYETYAGPGIRRVAEPDSEVLAYQSGGSIFRAYNALMEMAGGRNDLEALVLLHQDSELIDPEFCRKIREALRDPEVAIVGCAGAIGPRNISWWEGLVPWASFSHRYEEMGGGEIPGLSWYVDRVPTYATTGEVDVIDGFIMVMSPWAARNLRFDESLGLLHGYDLDICLQAKAAGKKVVTTDFRAIHHHSLDLIGDQEAWVAAHMRIAEKWEGRFSDQRSTDWKQRGRRAEAELEAMRVQLRLAEHYITRLSEDYHQMQRSKSWRWAEPLRWLGRVARRVRSPEDSSYRSLGEGVVPPPAELAGRNGNEAPAELTSARPPERA